MTTTVSSLQCHPLATGAVPPDMGALTASVAFGDDGQLAITYDCVVSLSEIRLPPPTVAGPANELWRHTCCEAFIGVSNTADYREFNFSPSGLWAVYDFSGYRVPCAAAPEGSPAHQFSTTPTGWRLIAHIPRQLLPRPDPAELDLSVTVVLEAADGGVSYWALTHPRENPDFHDRGGFILRGSEIFNV
jgi:hypothetical protein